MQSEREDLEDAAPAPSALLACALVSPYGVAEPDRLDLVEALHAQCARLTDRVAWRHPRSQGWPDAALLDLGPCQGSEAQMVCEPLMDWLTARQLIARIGIGPTQTIAQLAARMAAPGVIRAVAPEDAPGFLQRLAVEALVGLAVEGVTPELVARLRRYGLRTLGQVTQLHARDPQALRRQFGAAGGRLAALAQGKDLYPLHVTPAPARVAVRLRFSSGATADQALVALPQLAARLAQRLEASGQRGQALRLAVTWESGAITRARRRMARPLHQPGELTQAAHALLTAILTPTTEPASDRSVSVAALALALGDLSTRPPARQGALIEAPQATPATPSPEATEAAEARIERIALEVAEPLARRYGTPALYRLTTPQPDAILPEERARLVSLASGQSAPATNRTAKRVSGRTLRQRAETLDEALSDHADDRTQAPQPHWW